MPWPRLPRHEEARGDATETSKDSTNVNQTRPACAPSVALRAERGNPARGEVSGAVVGAARPARVAGCTWAVAGQPQVAAEPAAIERIAAKENFNLWVPSSES